MLLFAFAAALVAVYFFGVQRTKEELLRPVKKWLLKKAISNWMRSQPSKFGKEVKAALECNSYSETGLIADEQEIVVERPVPIKNEMLSDELVIYGTDETRQSVVVKMVRLPNDQTQAEVLLTLGRDTLHVLLTGETTSDMEFSLGNLRLEMVEPFKAWRLWYNGTMTRTPEHSGKGKLVHVVFNILWKPLDNPMDNRKDGNPNLLANHFSSNGSFGDDLPSLWKILPEGFSQMGTLHGKVAVNENGNQADGIESEFYLHGFRRRSVVPAKDPTKALDIFPMLRKSAPSQEDDGGSETKTEFFGMAENGNGFRLLGINNTWIDGRKLWPTYGTTQVTDVDISPDELASTTEVTTLINISDTKGGNLVAIWPTSKVLEFTSATRVKLFNLTINGRAGTGILIRAGNDPISSNDESKPVQNICNENPSKVGGESSHLLDFSDSACLLVKLVGGKGASLAKIHHLVGEVGADEVKAAQGFCVTTNLFRKMLDLDKFTEIFRAASSGSGPKQLSLDEACLTVMNLIKSSDTSELFHLITHRLQKLYGANRAHLRFAVRSSGVLEDAADLSCAGQNETFLGVPESLISGKVLDCWASLFTAQSVQYRLNHGQPAVSEMAVVVQEMVDASSAGVLFTADPRTGNPFLLVATGNYGLGESVVSAACDPDTITLSREVGSEGVNVSSDKNTFTEVIKLPNSKGKWWSDVKIKEKVLGEKKTKIIYKSDGVAGGKTTEEVLVDQKDSMQFCVEDQTVIKLAQVALQMELEIGKQRPVDIEWAVDQSGAIYILQCRNLTALDAWTDFELKHELDAAIRVKVDRFTTANAGEVLPKAVHTISQSINACLDLVVQKLVYMDKGDSCPISPYRPNFTPLFQQRLFISMFQTFYANVDKEISNAAVCADLSIFGRQVINEEIRSIGEERFGAMSKLTKMKMFYGQIQLFRSLQGIIEGGERNYKNFKLDYSSVPRKALDVYERITEDLVHIYQTSITHMLVSSCSSATQIFIFMFLSEGKEPSEWGSTLFEDASKLLSVFQNVESAELPEDIDQLGDEIVRNGGETEEITKEFLKSTPSRALEWLEGNEEIRKAFETFMGKHGHRGYAEFDIGEPSWSTDPLTFVPILRNTVRNKLGAERKAEKSSNSGNESKHLNDDELLDSLSTPLKPMTRRLLKLILPTNRNAVVGREKSKSMLIRAVAELKLQYAHLAKLMVEENLLPSEGLITHLKHYEIGRLIKKDVASAVILQKAMKRQRLYPQLEKIEFPEICIGPPEELDTSAPIAITDTLQATPVSSGVANGIAKVCLSVDEASENLKPGDILITHGTDIAWSPFFPILGGVVTELGGLISHGAVVAREYGLPCIVGAVNATKIFKSGDRVILDAGKGTLSRVFE